MQEERANTSLGELQLTEGVKTNKVEVAVLSLQDCVSDFQFINLSRTRSGPNVKKTAISLRGLMVLQNPQKIIGAPNADVVQVRIMFLVKH